MFPSPMSPLGPRDILADAKDTLSSWDKCMAKTYCKSVASAPSLTHPCHRSHSLDGLS
jgi:hypothetical protein